MHNCADISCADSNPVHSIPRDTFDHGEFGVGIRDSIPVSEVIRPGNRACIRVIGRRTIPSNHPNAAVPHDGIKYTYNRDTSAGNLCPCQAVFRFGDFCAGCRVIPHRDPYRPIPERVITNAASKCGVRETHGACPPCSTAIGRYRRRCPRRRPRPRPRIIRPE